MNSKMLNRRFITALPKGSPKSAQCWYSIWCNFLLAILFVGYPISASISQLLERSDSEINIFFRFLVLILSIILMISSITKRRYRLNALIVVFLFFYTIRFIFDLFYSSLPNVQRDLTFFVSITLIPLLALGGSFWWYDEKSVCKQISLIGGLAGLMIAYILIFKADSYLIEIFGGRAAFTFLNPISIGYHGLYIASAASILFFRSSDKLTRLVLGVVLFLGVYLMVMSGSRGPFVSLVFAAGLVGLANPRASEMFGAIGLVMASTFLTIGALGLVLERFEALGTDASSIERLEVLRLSYELGMENLLFGFAYIEPTTGYYPHNLIVEATMALGLFGGALMILMQILLLLSAWRLARKGEWLLPILAAVQLVNAWISGSIWGGILFF
ncbi:MAG: O-antigen ligase family protein, partial [Burkholderiaceae bacterium]|nr:O-antigen ligase family protein [Burkholderiaceae bacterium]